MIGPLTGGGAKWRPDRHAFWPGRDARLMTGLRPMIGGLTMTGSIVGNIDVAQVVLYAFWIFFAGLIWYLRQEDRREGYPLEDDAGRYNKAPFLFIPRRRPLPCRMAGASSRCLTTSRDERPLQARRVMKAPGYPIEPTGNPMLAGVGPGSWAERAGPSGHDGPRRSPYRAASQRRGLCHRRGRKRSARAWRSLAATAPGGQGPRMSGSTGPNI